MEEEVGPSQGDRQLGAWTRGFWSPEEDSPGHWGQFLSCVDKGSCPQAGHILKASWAEKEKEG